MKCKQSRLKHRPTCVGFLEEAKQLKQLKEERKEKESHLSNQRPPCLPRINWTARIAMSKGIVLNALLRVSETVFRNWKYTSYLHSTMLFRMNIASRPFKLKMGQFADLVMDLLTPSKQLGKWALAGGRLLLLIGSSSLSEVKV